MLDCGFICALDFYNIAAECMEHYGFTQYSSGLSDASCNTIGCVRDSACQSCTFDYCHIVHAVALAVAVHVGVGDACVAVVHVSTVAVVVADVVAGAGVAFRLLMGIYLIYDKFIIKFDNCIYFDK